MKTPGQPRKWNRDKTVAYVCECYGSGELLVDVCKRIGLNAALFRAWKMESKEYQAQWAQAELNSADAQRDRANLISERRDRYSLAEQAKFDAMIKRMRAKLKAKIAARKAALEEGQVLVDDDDELSESFIFNLQQEHERTLRARNEMQLKASQWYAKVTDPGRFGERVDMTHRGDAAAPLTVKIEFVVPTQPEDARPRDPVDT